jgi:hypothetical protein
MLQGNTTTASAVETLTTTGIGCGTTPGTTGAQANSFGVCEVVIPGYVATTWAKSCLYRSFGLDTTGATNQYTIHGGGFWNNTAAVTRVGFTTSNAANFVIGSQLRIYGRL